jgi:hypothetical protein
MAPAFPQPLTEMIIRNILGDEAWLVHKANNLTSIGEPVV